MTADADLLHVAARRYCAERFRQWADDYQRLVKAGDDRRGSNYTLQAYRIFPRYQVIDAIRTELERLTGTNLGTLEEARELFALVGYSAESAFTSYAQPEAQDAVRDEREAFACLVRQVRATALAEVEPLPYARVLGSAEAEHVWDSVERAWGLRRRECWYPLVRVERTDAEAFQAPHFLNAVHPRGLGALLKQQEITRVWELREYGPEYERDVDALQPDYNGAEGIWTSSSNDWIIYASHESSITVGGWMLAAVKRMWPEWERHIWTTPFFE